MSAPQNNCGYLGYSCCWANWANSSLANWSEPPQCFTLKVFTLKVSLSTSFFSLLKRCLLPAKTHLRVCESKLCDSLCLVAQLCPFFLFDVGEWEHVTNHPSARKSLANAVVSVSQHVGDRPRADSRAHVCIQRCLHSVYTLRLLMRGADVHFLTRHACNTNEDGSFGENA